MDRATRSAAYDNGAAVENSAARLAGWRARSAAVRQSAEAKLDLVYGPKPRNRIDLFESGSDAAPLLAFVHGGYWQRNAKEDFACMAIGPLARGCDVALIGYTLAPEATLGVIVEEIRAALRFLRWRDAAAGVSRRLIVSGWSAGGHLAALSLCWPEVDAAVSISGIHDLEPLRGTSIGDPLHLTDLEIADLSPIRQTASGPVTIAFGLDELPELCRQSVAYHEVLRDRGSAAMLLAIAKADHFSILDELMEPGGVLTRAIVALSR